MRRLAPDRPDRRGRRPAQGRPRVPARALARDVGERRPALLQRHHPRHLRAQEGRGEAQGRPRDRAGPDRRGRPRRHDRDRQRADRQAVRLRPRADRRPPGRGALRRAHPHAGRRALPRRAAEQGQGRAGRPRHGPRAVGPAPGRHRVPGRRHGLPAADRRRHRPDRHHPRHHGAQALREPAPAPRRPRRADRAVQPSPLRPGAGRVRRLRRALRRRGRDLPARPGPLQVRQRHPRPQGRRRGHPRGRPRAA